MARVVKKAKVKTKNDHDQKDLVDRLSVKEQKFVLEYMLDGNAARAARAIGYSSGRSTVTGSNILQRPHVKAAIDAIAKKDREAFEIQRWEILWHLAACATRSGKDYVDEKNRLTPVSELTDAAAAAIDGFKQKVRRYTKDDGTEVEEVDTEVKLVSKAQALDMALRHKGLFAAEKVETTVSVDNQILRRFLQEMHVPLTLDVDPIEQKIQALSHHKEQDSE